MTIFLNVLTKLISEKLSPLLNGLTGKSKGLGHNHNLSKEQYEIILALFSKIVPFKGTGNDAVDYVAVTTLIEAAREEIQAVREKHRVGRDDGETIGCINLLLSSTKLFYSKLNKLNFKLLNKVYTETPENIIYFHAAYYFGEDIFTPIGSIDLDIRDHKEDAVVKRLESLPKLIKPTSTMEEQIDWSLRVLSDLATDNKAAIKPSKKKTAIPIPGITFFGISLTAPMNMLSASEGRMGDQIKAAVIQIEKLKLKAKSVPEHKAEAPKKPAVDPSLPPSDDHDDDPEVGTVEHDPEAEREEKLAVSSARAQ